MKGRKIFQLCLSLISLPLSLGGCTGETYQNPGDSLGGGGEVTDSPAQTETSSSESVQAVVDEIDDSYESSLPGDAIQITEDNVDDVVSAPGNYYVEGELNDQIEIQSDGVTLYLVDADITNRKKVIKCDDYDLNIVLIGDSTIANSNTDDPKNAIDVEGDLVITGTGSLTVTSMKHGIGANSIAVVGATLHVNSQKDGLHAEIGDYDGLSDEPTPSYDDGGYVYLSDADVTIDSVEDGIQADTFIYITGGSTLDVLAGGGSPDTVTEASSDSASGKGIKVGTIDWEDADGDEADIDWDGYLLWIDDADIYVDSDDDALHSDGQMLVEGGDIQLLSGDDAMHSDDLLQITDGTIDIDCCYEGIESAKVEISGGDIDVVSYEDGINAADGTSTAWGSYNSNCHIIISGGRVTVDCIGSEGDGIDSNGTMLISGGEVYVAGSSSHSDAALDSDGGILVDGGYLFAVGQLGMVETPASNSAQYCVSFARSSSIAADTTLYLTDSDGEIIMYFTTPRSCQSVILSCPEFQRGSQYSIYAGDSALSTFTISSTITTVGSSSSINNPGGSPGGNTPGSGSHGFGGR